MYVITGMAFKTSFLIEVHSNISLGVFKSSLGTENQVITPSFFNVK